MKRSDIQKTRRWVVKVGSSLLTDDGKGINVELIEKWASEVAELRSKGVEIVWVSSGSVAVGIQRLGWNKRPDALHELQVAASVGQAGLVNCYDNTFSSHKITTGQVLLTHADFKNRQRYLNASATFRSMIELGVLPIVNENDTVAVDEIRFGDNDSLAAMVANLIDADLLVILTDQEGLYDDNPSSNPEAKFISEAEASDERLMVYASGAGALGTGGMATKLKAAQIANRTGASTVLANGRLDDVLTKTYAGESIGTLLSSSNHRLTSRKQWLANQLHVTGSLTLDEGAVAMLQGKGKSLLPIGVTAASGDFGTGDLVSCLDQAGNEIARGLVNYPIKEAQKVLGKKSQDVQAILGYTGHLELIHRDNLVIL